MTKTSSTQTHRSPLSIVPPFTRIAWLHDDAFLDFTTHAWSTSLLALSSFALSPSRDGSSGPFRATHLEPFSATRSTIETRSVPPPLMLPGATLPTPKKMMQRLCTTACFRKGTASRLHGSEPLLVARQRKHHPTYCYYPCFIPPLYTPRLFPLPSTCFCVSVPFSEAMCSINPHCFRARRGRLRQQSV